MKTNLTNLFSDFLVYKKNLENKRDRTLEAYERDLFKDLLPFLTSRNITDIKFVKRKDIEDFLILILSRSETGSADNRNRKLAAIKSLLKFAESRHVKFDKSIIKISKANGSTKPITYLSEEETDRLLKAIEVDNTQFHIIRDLAIMKLFLTTGIRVSELINLKLTDIEFHSKGLSYIYINRKGGNIGHLPINKKCEFALKTYISKRKNVFSPYLFLSKNGNQLDANSVYALVKHYLGKAGIHKRKHGPHILRHTVGVSLRRRGTDIATIQQILGHKKLETTAIYLNVEPQDLEKAVQLL